MSKKNESFLDRIIKESKDHPEKIIVKDKWHSWTWKEFMSCASKFANSILTENTNYSKPTAVPILVGRSGKVMAAIIGCLMTGNAFSPISIKQPVSRIEKIINLLDSDYVLSALDKHESFEEMKFKIINESNSKSSDYVSVKGDDPLYILFTSGSTGEPKGVICSHNNILNTIIWSSDYLKWNDSDVIGCATQFSFDISMFDVFTVFFYGIPITIFPELSNPKDIMKRIIENKVTSIFSVPAFFSQFINAKIMNEVSNSDLRRIISGGDFFPPNHLLEWSKNMPKISIYNVWGPTETSIVNTMHKITNDDLPQIKKGKHPSIGREHPLMPLVLMNDDEEITVPNKIGEIWMLGSCVSQGYLNDPKQTEKRYVIHRGLRAFRTGDLAYGDDDGNLYMSRRADSVVKISGYRIDLTEVENAIMRLSEVNVAVAFVQDIKDHYKELWLALELKETNSNFDVFAAKKYLRKILPQYMVPKRLFVLSTLPLNFNGKIDREKIKKITLTSDLANS